MTSAVIRVDDLGKRYRIGERRSLSLREALPSAIRRRVRGSGSRPEYIWALRNISFEVESGHVTGIIGRNGAGKSTLLKILSRITRPTEGRAEVWGSVGSLLEVGTGFHLELTGRENVYLNGSILGMTKREMDRKFDEIVAFAETARFIDTPIKYYSSGMQVRLAFAVAAHLEPEVLIVDEVLAVGDAAFQRKCLGKMQDVAGEGRTVLFVSHNMHAVASLCDHAVWLDGGRITSMGPAREQVASYTAAVLPAHSADSSDEDAESPVQIRNVRVSDPTGQDPQHLDAFTSFSIEFDVSRRADSRPVRFVIRIRSTEDDAVVLATTSWDSPDSERDPGPGDSLLRCVIPGNFLNAGGYSVSVGADAPGGAAYVQLEDVLRFTIISSIPYGEGLYGARDGYLSPYREWQTIPADAEARP